MSAIALLRPWPWPQDELLPVWRHFPFATDSGAASERLRALPLAADLDNSS